MNQKKVKKLRKIIKDLGYDDSQLYSCQQLDKDGSPLSEKDNINLGYIQRTFIEEPQGKQRKGDILKEETIVPFIYGVIECYPDSFKGKYRVMKKYYKYIKFSKIFFEK